MSNVQVLVSLQTFMLNPIRFYRRLIAEWQESFR
jgi:hypothetical protein